MTANNLAERLRNDITGNTFAALYLFFKGNEREAERGRRYLMVEEPAAIFSRFREFERNDTGSD